MITHMPDLSGRSKALQAVRGPARPPLLAGSAARAPTSAPPPAPIEIHEGWGGKSVSLSPAQSVTLTFLLNGDGYGLERTAGPQIASARSPPFDISNASNQDRQSPGGIARCHLRPAAVVANGDAHRTRRGARVKTKVANALPHVVARTATFGLWTEDRRCL